MATAGSSYFGRDLEAMSFARNYHDWILGLFEEHLHGSLAEVGAGSGNLSEMLLERSRITSLSCYEPSSNMYPLLEERLRTQARAVCTHGFFGYGTEGESPKFDAVLYANVLEHVEDDAAELALVHKALRPGGKLLVFVPAGAWLFSDFDRSIGHFRRYGRKGLVKLVRSAGFTVESCHFLDSIGVIPWFLLFVLMRKTLSGGNVALYDRLVVPWLRRLEGVCRPPFGKNLVMVATAVPGRDSMNELLTAGRASLNFSHL